MSNVLRFNNGACEKTRLYLDSYISGELMVETNHEVLAHLDICPDCRAEHDLRSHLRARLREAARREEVPPDLAARLHGRLQASASHSRHWLAVAAAFLVGVTAAIYYAQRHATPIHTLNMVAQEVVFARLSGRLPALLRAGLGDHLHCTVARKFPEHLPPTPKMLPSDWAPLGTIAEKLIPAGFRVIMAHRCKHGGRQFVHLTFRGEGKWISLIVLKKRDRESFAAESLLPSLQAAGVPVYQRGVDTYQVAGFESGQYLAYVVSDLPDGENLQLAAALAEPVKGFLDKLKS